ncbi:hypothetical protein, partial [Escherichia coli]
RALSEHKTLSISWSHYRAAFHQDFRKIRNHASEFTDLIILILIYFEKGIGIYAVFLKILIIGMDFRARKGFYMDTLLIISSSHHQQFTSLFRV